MAAVVQRSLQRPIPFLDMGPFHAYRIRGLYLFQAGLGWVGLKYLQNHFSGPCGNGQVIHKIVPLISFLLITGDK
jgi:hypothetical protein